MTARLLTSMLWIALIIVPIRSTIPEKIAEYIFSFMPNAPLLIKSILTLLIGISATYAIFKYLLIDKIRESTGSPEKNPDHIAPFAIFAILIVSIVYIVLKLNNIFFGMWSISNILAVDILVIFGLLNGAGKRAMPDDIEKPEELLSIQADGIDSSDQIIESEFTWIHNEDPFTSTGKSTGHSVKVSVPRELVDRSIELSKEDMTKNNYMLYVTQTTNSSVILSIAAQLREIAIKNNLRDFAELHLVFSFFSCFNYIEDEKSETDFEYTKYPAQTIADLGGDSIDVAIICSAVLARLGYRAFLSSVNEHAFVGVELPDSSIIPLDYLPVHNGIEMFICEIAPGESTEDETRKLEFWYNSNPEKGVSPVAFTEVVSISSTNSSSEKNAFDAVDSNNLEEIEEGF